MKHPKTTSKRLNKKKVREPFHLFFRLIPEVFFHRAHRQSLPLGQFSGGRATQKVAQTKTQLGRVSFMSSAEAGPAAAGPATAVTKPGGFEGTALLGKDKHVVELTWSYVRGGGGASCPRWWMEPLFYNFFLREPMPCRTCLYLKKECAKQNSDNGFAVPTPRIPLPEILRLIWPLFKTGDV